jgi:hypothetical protein
MGCGRVAFGSAMVAMPKSISRAGFIAAEDPQHESWPVS